MASVQCSRARCSRLPLPSTSGMTSSTWPTHSSRSLARSSSHRSAKCSCASAAWTPCALSGTAVDAVCHVDISVSNAPVEFL